MLVEERIKAFSRLGEYFRAAVDEAYSESYHIELNDKIVNELKTLITSAEKFNPWFVPQFMEYNFRTWSDLLTEKNIENWLSNYDENLLVNSYEKNIAVIMAGNVPLVGFHDLLSVLMSSNNIIIKQSSKDFLIEKIVQILCQIEPKFKEKIKFEDEIISNFDAIIATGSNNSKRYFDYYFSKYPSIIRSNRNSIAVLNGEESEEDLEHLADDIFLYFGLGCRNVSKIFVPQNYDITKLFPYFEKYKNLFSNHFKYLNNYDYFKSIFLVNREKFFDNGFIMLKESEELSSPIPIVYFQYYNDVDVVKQIVNQNVNDIQVVVSNNIIENSISFGSSQKPALDSYADNINTLEFLFSLKNL